MAAIIYLYAQYKGVDVSVGEDTNILSYADFDDITEYAVPAIQYVAGSGIMGGVSQSEIAPQGISTRAQVATVIVRMIETFGK